MESKKLGFVVNPLAGMGGKVGLKGSDGYEILRKARDLGAEPESPRRSAEALKRISLTEDNIEIITYLMKWGRIRRKSVGITLPSLVQ